MHRFVFVLEQTLGHAAHARNLERVLAAQPDIEATIIPITFDAVPVMRRLPGLRTWSVRASWAARAALRKRFRQGPVDAVYVHTHVVALLVHDEMRRAPTVVSLDATSRGFDSVGAPYGHRRQGRMAEAGKRLIHRQAFARAAALVTWSQWAADSLVRDYGTLPERVSVIPPGVDLARFRPAPPVAADGAVRVLFVGGDFLRKGGLDLLRTARDMAGSVELDIVTSSAAPPVPGNVSCRIHRGMAPQSKALVDLYRRADLFVLPSRGDCSPQAIAEAMASGLPVVASDVGAIREMVRDGENGYLVPVGDVASLRRAVETLIERPMLRRAMGRRSREIAEREHDADRNNRSILSLMTQLADRPAEELAWTPGSLT
jgi:glycosyltransferase involved in cell wall biosynthesis